MTPHLLEVARAEAPADLLLEGGRIVNVFTGEVEEANVAIADGRIAGIGDYSRAQHVINLNGSYAAPGFIDAHMHVESTMLPPSEFVKLVAPHGTTGVVLDPHEIANVLGIPGIRYIMQDAQGLPLDAMFALSSCVPSSPLETSGARLEAEDLAPLFDDPRVVALAEVMNYPGVVRADPGLLAKIALGLKHGVVDGHAPGLRAHDLNAYIAAGVSSDHECTTADEAAEKLRRGMHIHIREGSAARNLEALLPLITPTNAHRFSFCTDDRHPMDLLAEGHIDHIVRKAIFRGLDPVTAIAVGSLHTAVHYRRPFVGAVAPGYFANLIVFDDLHDINPRLVFYRAALISVDGRYEGPDPTPATPPPSHVRIPASLSESSFRVPATSSSSRLRVIGMDPHQLVTESLTTLATVRDGLLVANADFDVLKLAVIERHRGTGNIGIGFVKGNGIRNGALASTVGHDSHNLTVVGDNDRDMLVAAKALAQCGGGQCAVRNGTVLGLLPLPIAGLMSDQPLLTVLQQQQDLLGWARLLGCPHHDPFMPLSFLALPVIPHLKLTDLGLVDVDQFKVVPLEL
jgi:adenine deaminase